MQNNMEKADLKHNTEMRQMQKNTTQKFSKIFDHFNSLHLHVSCLGCDQIKQETMKLVCGHNICRECLNQYSYTDNTESSIRCDVCAIETKVVLLSVSIANRAISSIMLDA